MKNPLLALSAILLMTSCASVKVIDTQVASGAATPRAIYIRPFDVKGTHFVGPQPGGPGERPIRQSLAGREFADDLKYELSKLAPSMVIERNEVPEAGWLVEGSLDVVNSGPLLCPSSSERRGNSVRSQVVIHVRISEMGAPTASSDKDSSVLGKKGRVIYEFDLAGGTYSPGLEGSLDSAGLGYSVPFDFKLAAERVLITLSKDPFKYGRRSTPGIR